jgi:hypothetical protein
MRKLIPWLPTIVCACLAFATAYFDIGHKKPHTPRLRPAKCQNEIDVTWPKALKHDLSNLDSLYHSTR